jgi:hypothetical protein
MEPVEALDEDFWRERKRRLDDDEQPKAPIAGISRFDAVNWSDLFAPAHTPDAVIARLTAEALNAPFPFTKTQFHKRCETASFIHRASTSRNRCCTRCCISSWNCWRA